MFVCVYGEGGGCELGRILGKALPIFSFIGFYARGKLFIIHVYCTNLGHFYGVRTLTSSEIRRRSYALVPRVVYPRLCVLVCSSGPRNLGTSATN